MSRYINVFSNKPPRGPEYKSSVKLNNEFRELLTVWPLKENKPNITINIDVLLEYIKESKNYIYEKEEFKPTKPAGDKPVIKADNVIDPDEIPF